jgi:hypothetical protein
VPAPGGAIPGRAHGIVPSVLDKPDVPGKPGTVAFLLLTHRGQAQVARLAARLETGRDTVVAVHHDPTGEPMRLPSSVAMIPDPVPCPWGRLSRAIAIHKSLAWIRANVPTLSWVLITSGQDYPIRSVTSIEDELATAGCDAFLRHFRLDGDPAADQHMWQTRTRQRYVYRRRLPGSARSVPLPWPRRHRLGPGVSLYSGSHWANFSLAAVNKVVDSPLNEPLLRYLRWAPMADEAWTATMVLNGEPRLTVVNDRRRYMRWGTQSPHPAVLGPGDLPALRASTDFFARKMDLARWPAAFDVLDELAESRENELGSGNVTSGR